MQNRSFITNLKTGILNRVRSLFKNPYQKAGLNWFRVKQLKHLTPGKLRKQLLFGKTLCFKSPPELLHGLKEIFVEELYKQDLPEEANIIDCGANIGLSVIYIKKMYPKARIIAFEPDEVNFELLKKNIESFGYTEDTILRKEAVWIEDTQLSFSASGSMSSRINDASNSHTKMVQAIRLKELLKKQVDFLKMDIEGAEYTVLNDIKDNLDLVKNMFIEYHGDFSQTDELSKILGWLSQQKFSYYIKEAANIYSTPFKRKNRIGFDYDVQLNIFCFRN